VATVQTYVSQIQQVQQQVAMKMGSSIIDKRLRILLASSAVPVAVLIKVLVDKGVVTNAELQNALTAAMNDVWPEAEEPTE
jgi:hypothetical protein